MDDAPCTGLHQDMFYPPIFKKDRVLPESAYYRLGKFVCEHCTCRRECLFLGMNEEVGIWGGCTPKERKTGEYSPNKTFLDPEAVSLLPKASPLPLDITATLVKIKPYLKRRPRKS